MNVLVLSAGDPGFDPQDGGYPLSLAEFDGVPLIQMIADRCKPLSPQRFICAMRRREAGRFHLDNVVRLLMPDAVIIRTEGTKGAACTALLAAAHIDNDDSLLVVSANELLDVDLAEMVASFTSRGLDGGVVTFGSVHPRYSYVRLDESGLVTEAAEKNPISRNATAGMYWFARGRDLVAAIKEMIRKNAQVDGLFYVCPAINEMVLAQARIGAFAIAASQYHPLKTERQLHQLEMAVELDGRKKA